MEKTLKNEKDYKSETEKKLKKITNHQNIHLLNSGNSAILTTIKNIKGQLIIPNQGAWHGFKQAARIVNKEFKTIPTNNGLIELENLKEIKENSALLITSFAGYSGEQNIKEISKYCRENNILLIEDASGGIGDNKEKLGNGKYSDIIIGSTGSPKTLNVGNGGFISTNIENFFDDSKFLLKSLKADPITISGIYKELDYIEGNFKKTVKACQYLKSNLDKEIIHKDKRSLNITFKCENNKEIVNILRDKINVESRSIITLCPNYNRLKIKGFSLEIKNLDYSCYEKENLEEIINIIENIETWKN